MCDELTENAREQTLAYKRDRWDEERVRTLVAERDGRLVDYVAGEVVESSPISTRETPH